jgi:hypothetical protein
VIFVSVAAFCDPWLPFTVRDACAKAVHPERLVFAVFEQDVRSREVELRAITDGCGAALRYRQVHPVESQGVCWARAAIGEMYGGEPWLLQIDSHMLFEPRWDEQLIAQHAEVGRQSAKPIITCYPWAFEIENGQPTVARPPSSTTTLVMRPVPEARLDPSSATMMFRTEHIAGRTPVRGCHVAAGFVFAQGALLCAAPYDPMLYFHGEEQSLTLRAWTRGWDIWHMPHIPVYHLYKRPHTENRSHHWHPEWEAQREVKHHQRLARAEERLADLLYERRKDLGDFGLGADRSLDDYAVFSGIDYRRRSVVQEYRPGYGPLRLWSARYTGGLRQNQG